MDSKSNSKTQIRLEFGLKLIQVFHYHFQISTNLYSIVGSNLDSKLDSDSNSKGTQKLKLDTNWLKPDSN